jgi:arabinogalactan oligomer / maltooligosaccharide transport system substrate-binding protein
MNRKNLKGVIAFLVFALIFSACAPANNAVLTPTPLVPGTGDDLQPTPTEALVDETTPVVEETPTEVDTTPEEPEAEVTPTPLASVEGTLTIWSDADRVEVITELGRQFTEQYNVPVAVQELAFGDIRDQLRIAGPAGEGPDIIVGAHDWLGELVANGLIEPLDLGNLTGSFDPVAIEAFTYEGQVYGMPYAVEAVALIYNRDLVPEPPQTWEELKDIARELQETGQVDQGYVLQQADAYHFNPILTGFGGYIFGTTDEGYNPQDIGLDSEGGLAAARELNSMVQEGLLRQDVNYDIMASLFNQGRSAMMFGGPWMLQDIRAAGVNYGVAPIPTMEQEPQPFVGVQGFMVSAFGRNQLLARSFLNEYIADDDAMMAIYEAGLRSPAWTPIIDEIDDEDIVAFGESASMGQPMPAIPEMSAVWEALNDAITLIYQQQQDPEAAFNDAAQAIRDRIAAGQ